MKMSTCAMILGSILFLQSCTGQKPAPIKNSTTNNQSIKESCSGITFEGQVLSLKNILNIFDCSGWAKSYPELTKAVQESNQEQIDHAFKVFNTKIFSSAEKRKAAFKLTVDAENAGELDQLSILFKKSLFDHHIVSQVDSFLKSKKIETNERSSFLRFLSKTEQVNLKNLKLFQNLATVFENHKADLVNALEAETHEAMNKRIVVLLNDLAKGLETKEWRHVSKIIFENDSTLKQWAIEGLGGDIKNLLTVVEGESFLSDVRFFKKSLDNGIVCENTSSEKNFSINLQQEIKHKVEILKKGTYEEFEKTILHGFSKFVAFQGFCLENKKHQGLDAFANVMDYVFDVIPVTHDYRFLKNIHTIFGEDRYAFLRFLASDNFSQWRELFLVLKDQDVELVRVLYKMLSDISNEDLETLSMFLGELAIDSSQSSSWYKSWAKIWNGLSDREKEDFVDFLTSVSDKEIVLDTNLAFITRFMEAFPGLSKEIAESLDNEEYQRDVRYLISRLSDKKVQDDLSGFLSNKGLFEFFKIMSSSSTELRKPIERERKPSVNTYVLAPEEAKISKTRECFYHLSAAYKKNTSYYSLVNTLPDVCLNTLGEVGFVGQIYLWMNTSQKYFQQEFGVNDFHTEAGVWAPGMLHFIFTAAIKIDHSMVSSAGLKGIKLNLDDIYKTVTDPGLLEALHLISNTYEYVSKKIPFEPRIQDYLESQSNEQRRKWAGSLFSLLKSEPNSYPVSFTPFSCKDLSKDLGANPCLSNDEFTNKVEQMLRILKRRNVEGKTSIQELVRWLHPNGGISLPFLKTEKYKHHTSFDEIIRFLYDLSSEKTVKEFTYNSGESKALVKGSTIDRLEVVMRDISFMNNFYGAYFKNVMASADNYREEVIKSKKLLTLLQKLSGPIRTFGTLETSSKWKIQNVKQTYWSLVEISDEYDQLDGTKRTYGDFIQSLLAAIGSSSRGETQNFSAYRIPNEKIPEGHNGILLTKLVEISGLRHLANYVRSHFKDLSVLETKELKQIDSQLISRFDMKLLQDNIQRIMDQYFDNDRNQLNMMLADLVKYASTLSTEDQKSLEEIVVKLLLVLSHDQISTATIEKLSSGIETVIKMWPEFREILVSIENPTELLKIINSMLNSMEKNPKDLNNLLEMIINSKTMSLSEMEDLLKEKDFRTTFIGLLNHLSMMKAPDTNLNWVESFRSVFSSSDFKWDPVIAWLDQSMDKKPEHKLTVSLLLHVLGDKKDGNYRFKMIMDEFLLTHRSELNQFLTETFPALEIKD